MYWLKYEGQKYRFVIDDIEFHKIFWCNLDAIRFLSFLMTLKPYEKYVILDNLNTDTLLILARR